MKSYTTLFVDWHLTLSTSVFWEQFSDPAHPSHPFFTRVQRKLFASDGANALALPWMRGLLTSEEIVAEICRDTSYEPDFALQTLQASCQRMRLVSDAIPDLVTRLRAHGLRIVIATDNMDTFHRWTVPSLRLHTLFDDILSSWQQRALKADKDDNGRSRFFAGYLQAHQIGRGESLLLDDGDEEFGTIIRRFGIDYQHVEPGRGLVPALQALVASFS